MYRLRLAILLAVFKPSLAYGPVHLNFGPPDLVVDGWEAAFATVTGTPFLQLTSLDPPVFGFWGGNYQGVSHESGADAFSSFSVLPEGAYLCLMSVPIGSYSLQVIVGSSNSSVSSCLESDSGSIFDGSSTAGENVTVTKVVHKQTLESCLTLRACAATTVVNTWKVEEISCHSSCAFCTGTSEVECAIGCNEGRTLQEGQNSSGTCVARVPFAPSSLSVSQVTNSSLRLSWVSGLSGGEEVTDHHILLEGVEFVTTSSSEAYVDLFGLLGDTMYSFKVQAISAAGLGDLSDALEVRTGPVLPWAPRQLQGVANRYSVNLSWTPPSYDGGAAVVGYLVTTGEVTWSTDDTEVLADGLQGFTFYTFQVQARNVAGLGVSNFTTVQTLEAFGAMTEYSPQLHQTRVSLRMWKTLHRREGQGFLVLCQARLARTVPLPEHAAVVLLQVRRFCSRTLLGAVALGATAVASHGWRPSASHVVDTFVAPTLRPRGRSEGRPWGTGRPNPDMRTQRAAFGGGRPGPRGPMAEPEWLGSLFFGLIILSFIPGPWQVILSPIIGLINLFYMFKFGIFLLAIAAIFGLQWYFEATTMEGQCPQCGALQRGSKNEPFNCGMCGTELEVKDDQFVRYMKSGQAPQNPFEKIKDMAQEAAEKQVSKATPASPKSKKSSSEVVDVEVL